MLPAFALLFCLLVSWGGFAEAAAEALGLAYELVKVTDIKEIMRFGVMMTPALAVDGVVKVAGRVVDVEAIRQLLGWSIRTGPLPDAIPIRCTGPGARGTLLPLPVRRGGQSTSFSGRWPAIRAKAVSSASS